MQLALEPSRAAASDPAQAFDGGIGALTADAVLRYFLTRAGVNYPRLPKATEAQFENAAKVLERRFDLVGEEFELRERFSWKVNPSRDREWQIAHHKFHFAVDLIQAYRASGDAKFLLCWRDLIGSWLAEMGTGFITASDAQVEAKRVEHWAQSFALLRGTSWGEVVGPVFLRRFLERIESETCYIAQNLRASRNHRTFQLYTIFLVGVLFPEFRRHKYFVQTGRTQLTENLLSDFAADGVHVELSTHYHNITLETALAFVELARLNGIDLEPALLERLHCALEFSAYMQWPDGKIPLINDSDNGDHRPMLELGSRLANDPRLLWAATLGRDGMSGYAPSKRFEHAGYFIFCDGWGRDAASYAGRQHVFYDCAGLGEGSHSHYDLFSFCYFLNGEQVIVDPGRYTYCAEPDAQGVDWRREFKSTAHHNTVTIDGKDQTRYLSKARRPPPGVERYEPSRHPAKHGPDVEVLGGDFFLGERSDWVCATALSHEYTPLHTRVFMYMAKQYLIIFDHIQVNDGAAHECALRFHLAHQWQGRVGLAAAGGEIVARSDGWQLRTLCGAGLAARLESGWVSKTYGVKQAAPVIVLEQAGTQSMTFCSVVAPDAGSSGGFSILGLRRLARAAPAAHLFQVDGTLGGEAFQDLFLFQCGERATYEDDRVRYRGKLLGCRRDRSGTINYLCAAHPEQLELDGGARFDDSRGHVEWIAAARR